MKILVAALLLLSAGRTLSDVSLQESMTPNGNNNSSESSTTQASVTTSSPQTKNNTVNTDAKAQNKVPPPSQNEPPVDAEAEALAQGVEKIIIVDLSLGSSPAEPATLVDSQLPSVAPGDDQRAMSDMMNRAPTKDERWAPMPNRKAMYDYQNYMGNRAPEQPVAYDYYYYNYYYFDDNYADYGYYANQPAYQYPTNQYNNYQNEASNNEWNKEDNELPKPQPTSQSTDSAQDIQQFRNRFLQSLQNFVPDDDNYAVQN